MSGRTRTPQFQVILLAVQVKENGIGNGLRAKQDKGDAHKMRISGLHRTTEPTEFRLVKPFFKGNNFFDFHIFDMYQSKILKILYVKLYVRKLEIPLETRKIQY